MAPDHLLYEYCIVRYVPRVDREEFINIGLIMLNKRNKWMKALILLDENRIRALYPGCDIELLRHQTSLFEKDDVPEKDLPIEEKFRWLAAVKSATIQVSPSHPGILVTEDHEPVGELMDIEFKRLFNLLVTCQY